MSDPVIIERKDLEALAEMIANRVAGSATEKAIDATLKAVGIRGKDIDPWISQNEAVIMLKDSPVRIGLPGLKKASLNGRVRCKRENMDKKRASVYYKKRDILKLINK